MSQRKKKLAVEPLLAVIVWGYAFTGIAAALRAGFQPQVIVTLRMAIAAVGFIALYAVGYTRYQPVAACDWPRLLLLTGVGIFIYHLALVNGQREVPAGIASLIVTSTAVWTYLFSILNGTQKWSWKAGAGLVLATAGMMLVVSQKGASTSEASWSAILLVFTAPVSLALYTILAKPLLKYGVTNLTAQIIILASFWLGILQMFSGDVSLPASGSGWFATTVTSLLSTLIAFTLWFRALETHPATTVAAYSYLMPIFGTVFAYTLLEETITWQAILGAVTMISGLVVIVRAATSDNSSTSTSNQTRVKHDGIH